MHRLFMQAALEQRLEAAQQTPPRVRDAEASLRAERARIEALLQENAALSQRAQLLQQQAAAVQDPPLPAPPVCGHVSRRNLLSALIMSFVLV